MESLARRHAQSAECAVAKDRLGVHALAGPIDAALGEHRAGEREALVAPRAVDVEAPRREVRVPAVDRRHGTVAA